MPRLACVIWIVLVGIGTANADDEISFPWGIEAAHPVLDRTASGWHTGGPVIALRLPTKAGSPTGDTVWSVGWEVARPAWLTYGLGVESDFNGVSVVPSVMASTPLLPLGPHGPPMAGVGLSMSAPLGSLVNGFRIEIWMMLGGVLGIGNSFELGSNGAHHALVVRASL